MRTLHHHAALAALLLIAATTACSSGFGAAPAEETEEPLQPNVESTQPPTAEATMQVIATPAPTEVAVGSVSFGGISFTPDASFGTATGQVVEGEPVDPNGPYWVLPQHIRFDFTGYPTTSTYHSAQVYVFPVANFAGYPEQGPHIIDALKTLLAAHPDLTGMGGMQNPLPLLPLFNAAQVIVAQPQYLDFQNGSGIRYLTQYDQAPIPINNNELFYTYQGITSDGQYYVAVIMPVSHPDLPSGMDITQEDYDAITANPEQYFTDKTLLLNSAEPTVFTPSLLLLDQMVQSLSVAPTLPDIPPTQNVSPAQ